MLRIGMLTSGGDCQALNAAMRGVVKGICSKRDDVEIYGFKDGYKGLIYADFSMLTPKDFSGILTRGGTILGTSRQPFKLMRVPDKDGLDKVEAMKHTYHKLNLNCLIILGGNGTHKTANLLREEGLNVITLPKTIDNDLWGTEMTFGFQSAVDIATDTIDRIHTTATSHSRVFIIEVMGHKVGYVTLHAGIAGGADIILLPEIPYDINVITDVINRRSREGKPFTILAVAEGAISKEDAKLKKKEYKEKISKRKYPSIAYENMFRHFAWKYSGKVSANIFYSDELSHKIYASCDAFLMPSLFEPCGLSQLMSLRYGTIPIVRETGGLRDTVEAYNEFDKTGTGFSFTNYNAHEMLNTVRYAERIYYDRKRDWNKIVERAMSKDFSWKNSAGQYQELYKSLIGE